MKTKRNRLFYFLAVMLGTITAVSFNLTTRRCYAKDHKIVGTKEAINTRILDSLRYHSSPLFVIKDCKIVLGVDPQNARAYYLLAQAYLAAAAFEVKTKEEKIYYRKLSIKNFKMAERLGYTKESAQADEKRVSLQSVLLDWLESRKEPELRDSIRPTLTADIRKEAKGIRIGPWFYDENAGTISMSLSPDRTRGYDYVLKVEYAAGRWKIGELIIIEVKQSVEKQ